MLSQTSYVIASFVNMVFSDWNKILIHNLYQMKWCNARQLRTMTGKGWTISSINRLLKKFRDTGTVDRRQGNGRPRSARTDENIDQVNDMVLSQENQHRTHSTVRAQELTEANCATHIFPKKNNYAFKKLVVVLFIMFFLFSAVKELWKSVKISPS